MDRAETQELRARESGNQLKHAALLPGAKPGLKSHQVPHLPCLVLAAQLQYCIGPFAGARITQTDRLHWAETQRVIPARCHHFDRQAALEVRDVFPLVTRVDVGRAQCAQERAVLFRAERAVQVIGALSFVPTRLRERNRLVDGIAGHDRCDRVVESEAAVAEQLLN